MNKDLLQLPRDTVGERQKFWKRRATAKIDDYNTVLQFCVIHL